VKLNYDRFVKIKKLFIHGRVFPSTRHFRGEAMGYINCSIGMVSGEGRLSPSPLSESGDFAPEFFKLDVQLGTSHCLSIYSRGGYPQNFSLVLRLSRVQVTWRLVVVPTSPIHPCVASPL